MKAVILAAGFGSRISDITEGRPKALLPLGGSTLLGQTLDLLRATPVDEVVLVTGYKREVVASYAAERWPRKLEVVFNPHFGSTNVLYSFWLALPYLKGEDFLFIHADTVFSGEVLDRLLAAPTSSPIIFAVDRHPCAEEEMKVQISGGRVTVVTKEMPSEAADGEFLGIARVSAGAIPPIRSAAEHLFEQEVFKAFFELAVQACIDRGELSVGVCDVSGEKWREVDFVEDYEAAKALFGA